MNGTYGIDLILINPSNRAQIYQGLGKSLTAVEPPVWAGLIATFVRRAGYSVAVVDAEAEELSVQETVDRDEAAHARLVVIPVYGHQPSASTQNMTAAGRVTTAIKQRLPQQKVFLAGGHVAALSERTLDEEDADFVSAGEGLYTILDLLAALKAGTDDFRKVRGLLYKDAAGQLVITTPAPLVTHLDEEMPEIAWDLLPMSRYRAHNWHCFGEVDGHGDLDRMPYAAIYTTLGCPYKCTFCCIQAPFKEGELVIGQKASVNSYRFWNPDNVIAQIDTLVNQYGVRNIKFADEMFVLHPRHVNAICDRIIARGYDLNIWAYARVDTVKDGFLPKLKAAGFNWLAFGIEAASERVRKDVQKGFTQEEMFRTLEHVRAEGINIIGNYIFGLPEDDFETMQETLDLALSLNCEMGNFYSAMAYPGSELYLGAIAESQRLPETWAGFSQHAVDTLPLPTKYISGPDVLAFRDRAFQTYFTAPSYLNMVERRFGPETVAHIREMTSHTLERRFVPAPSAV